MPGLVWGASGFIQKAFPCEIYRIRLQQRHGPHHLEHAPLSFHSKQGPLERIQQQLPLEGYLSRAQITRVRKGGEMTCWDSPEPELFS